MKIFFIAPSFSKRHKEFSIATALKKCGHTVLTYPDRIIHQYLGSLSNKLVKKRFRNFKPDLLLLSKADYLDLAVLKYMTKAVRSAYWNFDVEIPFIERHLAVKRLVDCLFITNASQIDEYVQKGIKQTLFLPQACDMFAMANQTSLQMKFEVSFIGNCNLQHVDKTDRVSLLEKVNRVYQLHVFGKYWDRSSASYKQKKPVYTKKFVSVCRSSAINLGMNADNLRNNLKYYTSNRLWNILSAGGFYLSYKNPGLEEFFQDGKHCVFYEDEEECLDKIEYYLKRPELREKISREGRKIIHKRHTYVHRIENVVNFQNYSPSGHFGI